jgi:hypothetical protein
MKQLLLTLAALVVICTSSMAAQQVLGLVRDDQGSPIAGVNIAIDGAPTGGVTDRSGEFGLDLDLADAHYITFTHVAYQPVMVKVTHGGPYAITMTLAVYRRPCNPRKDADCVYRLHDRRNQTRLSDRRIPTALGNDSQCLCLHRCGRRPRL